jgi:hypothetical protein
MLVPTVAIDAPHLGPKQKRFNKLVADVAKLEAALRAWLDVGDQIQRGMPELFRLQGEHRALVHEAIVSWDRMLPALTKAERKQLAAIICDTALDHLQGGPDDEIKVIYNRHSRSDFDAEVAADEAAQIDMMREVLGEHGIEVDPSIDSLDEFEAAAEAAVEEHQERAAAAETTRPKSKRQQAADARREAAQSDASKALQDVYRKLAMALHPDREPDEAERARKTALMADVNAAYERRDLLALLKLQLRFEQLDATQIAALAEDRLERFNRLLAEQVTQLKQELADLEYPYRLQLDMPPPRKLAPERVLALFHADIRATATKVAVSRRDFEAMREVAEIKAMLRAEREARRNEQDEMMRAMAELIGRNVTHPRRRRSR